MQEKMILFERSRLIDEMASVVEWDVVVIGGGASGLGVALDGISRGLKVLLLEKVDFAKGTSSKSTKLVHGGVRYLAQGNIDLVKEALRERGLLLRNAPHLVKNQTFVVPSYTWFDQPFYGIGLKVYDWLSGKSSLGSSVLVSKSEVLERIPMIQPSGLKGGVLYQDGQFDDARLAVNLAQTCIEEGGTVLNYFNVVGLKKEENGKINAVIAEDVETGKSYEIRTKSVVNATGVFVNDIIQMSEKSADPLVRPSQGAHIVLDKSFLNSEDAIMIPKTSDGRVLFAIPWHNRVIVGTTDIPVKNETLDPVPLEEEIEFILKTAAQYLTKAPTRTDVLATFAGLRPLAASKEADGAKTKEISRSHKVLVEGGDLVTITGGKWTTYRQMGEDTINKVVEIKKLKCQPSLTAEMQIHGAKEVTPDQWNDHLYIYGTDREILEKLINDQPDLGIKLTEKAEFTRAEVVMAVRFEMARTIEDILARRVRLLFLDAQAAIQVAPEVGKIMQAELSWTDEKLAIEIYEFNRIAKSYLL